MWLTFVLLVFTLANYDTDNQLSKEKTASAESSCTSTLVQAPPWVCSAFQSTTAEDCQDSLVPSFKGRLPYQQDHGGDGCLSMALRVRTPQWQTPYSLPIVFQALECWHTAQQRAKESSSASWNLRSKCWLGMDKWWPKVKEEQEGQSKMEERKCAQVRERQREGVQGTGSDAFSLCSTSATCHSALAIPRDKHHATASTCCSGSQHCPSCRAPYGCQKTLSGSFPSTGRYSEGSRQVREGHDQGLDIRLEQSLEASGKSCKTAFNGPRCSSSTPSKLVETSPRFCRQLAKATAAVQGSAERVWRSAHQGTTRAQCGQTALTASEQAGGRDWCSNFSGNRRNHSQLCVPGQLPKLRSRSQCACTTSTRKPPAEHRSCCCRTRGGGPHVRSRGRGRQEKQAPEIYGAFWRWPATWIWWTTCITQTVIFGSEDWCLRNELHVPFMPKEMPEVADAYCSNRGCSAACHPDLRFRICCHSIHWDPNFISEPVALGRATLLRNEVLSQLHPAPADWRLPLDSITTSKSCLRNRNWNQRKLRVTFSPFCEVIDQYFPPRFQPHGDGEMQNVQEPDSNDEVSDDSSFMARAPRLVQPVSDSSEVDSDFDEHAPTSPSSFPEHHTWQSAHVYDLKSNYGHGRIHTQPPEAMFTDLRRLLGYGFHDVANIFDILPAPADLAAANVAPFLLLAHDDVRFADNRRAILVDVELHGPHWDSTIEIDRYTTLMPTPTQRSLLLKIAGVLRYCTIMKNRCLLWHRGRLVHAKNSATFDLHHGDYVRIAVPPFQDESVPTYYAIRACQHGLTPRQIIHRHTRQPDPDGLFTDVEAAQGPGHDEQALFQSSIASLNWKTQDSPQFPLSKTLHSFEECQAPVIEAPHPGIPHHQHERQDDGITPAWRISLTQEFATRAAIANAEEGPIAFVTTWYLRGPLEQLSEESRPLRLDHFSQHWKQDLEELWSDRIHRNEAVNIVHVQPEPPQHDTSWTIGHLIVYQGFHPPLAPVLISINFITDRHTGLNHVAAGLNSPTNALHVQSQCRLQGQCTDRACELQLGQRFYRNFEPVHIHEGASVNFNVHPPVSTHHVGDEQQVQPQWLTTSTHAEQPIIVAAPLLAEQTEFTVSLFEHWDVHARVGPGHMERLLTVTTWCLHSDRLRMNDESRSVTLGDDFHAWEAHLRRRWQDLLDPLANTDFAIVWHAPESEFDISRIHIIVHQQLQPGERANLVTIYDDTVPGTPPYVTAAILPSLIGQTALLTAVHRLNACPPRNPHTVCTTWQRGWQFDDTRPYRCEHGQSFMLIINWRTPIDWHWDTEDQQEDTVAHSLLQVRTSKHKEGTRRCQRAGLVAHTQPPAQVLQLEKCIEPPPTVRVDFSSVLQFADELRSVDHLFGQPWPQGLELPDVTVQAFNELATSSTSNSIPTAFYFFTDGSKSKIGSVGAGVVLLIEFDHHEWQYGGCLYRAISTETISIFGEHGAIIWALLWAQHLSQRHWELYGHSPLRFSFNFDATSSGYMAAGVWRTIHAQAWRTIMRSLAQILQTRHHQCNIEWNHIKAHQGHPWNECADALAKWAADFPDKAGHSDFWEDWLSDDCKLCALQWIWYLELMHCNDPRVPRLINGHMTSLAPHLTVDESVHESPARPATANSALEVHFTIATANVLTLDQSTRTTSISRQFVLMQQFHDAQCTFVGVQETRHKHLVGQNNEFYHVFGHPADERGQDGTQLWISKRLPYSTDGDLISKDEVRILDSGPNFLVAKVHTVKWTCIIVTCRAPHSGRPRFEAINFWNHLTHVLQKKGGGHPVFFCGDANAHLGEVLTDAVGDVQAAVENQAGQVFHEWLLRHDLFTPATFPEHHLGESFTFCSPQGHETRIDYIAIPMQHYRRVVSSVAPEIDLSIARCDHRAVLCKVAYVTSCRPVRVRSHKAQLDIEDLTKNLAMPVSRQYLHSSITTPHWDLDPHASAQWLTKSTATVLPHLARPRTQWKRKSHITAETWCLVEKKKHLFKQLRALNKTRRFTVLQACFVGWKAESSDECHLQKLHRDLPAWLRLHDISIAQTQRDLKHVALQAQTAIRHEDARFYQLLAEQTMRISSVEGLNGIWKQLRNLLPKNRARVQHVRRDIDEELQKHFEALEAGEIVPHADLRQQCLQRNIAEQQQQDKQWYLDLRELPTLVEIENLCLRQRPRKAPGPDQIPADVCRQGAAAIAPHIHALACKSFVHGIEPYDFKGGKLCSIFKGKGDPADAAGYRGILLSNTYAKIIHAWSRQRLLPTLQHRKTLGQLGGLPSQQTVTGVQAVRAHSQAACMKHLSSATMFIDLRAAFHHMLRELIFATSNGLLLDVLETILDGKDFNLQQLQVDLENLCAQEITDIPPGLRQFLHDIHQQTWFFLKDEDVGNRSTHTKRGTRPGSPLADIGFNLMMSDLLAEVQNGIMQLDDYKRGADALGTYVPPIAWMDDVAICLTASLATELVPLIQDTTKIVHTAFQKRGLTLNLDKGKTELIVMFRGPGAVAQRTLLFDIDRQPTITTSTATHILTMRVASSYRHLGVRFAMSLDYDQEVSARVGSAHQAFLQMKTTIFSNKAIPLDGRLILFQSLVMSRLLYGCAAWAEISAASYKKLETTVIGFYRQICNEGFWNSTHLSDKEFMQSRKLTPFRIFWARHRLCYLHHLAAHGHTYHKSLLLMEFQHEKGWLHEVSEDLKWLATFHDLPFDIPTDREGWILAWSALRACKPWKKWVSIAVAKHLEQEKIAFEIPYYHQKIRHELEAAGMELAPSLLEEEKPTSFNCAQCDVSFCTAQQLALHEFRIHHQRAAESYLVQSEVCAGCLRTFHTTFRVVQHLRYRSNQCWDRLNGARPPAEPGQVHLPAHLHGVARLPAIRRHHGPLRPTSKQREILRVRSEISKVWQEGLADFAWWEVEQNPQLVEQCNRAFDGCLCCWFEGALQDVASFHNLFFNLMFSFDVPEFHAARLFIHWSETCFADFVPTDEQLEHSATLDEAIMTLLEDLHIWKLRLRYHQLQQQLCHLLQDEVPRGREPHHESQRRKARVHPFELGFAKMKDEEMQRRTWRMTSRPRCSAAPEQGPYFIVHLYAGRRREADFHHYMQEFIANSPHQWASNIVVISLDTAIDDAMNVHSPKLWQWLLATAREGRILGYLLGPPCETWSSARHEPFFDDDGALLCGPRPLRSAEQCWGLDGLRLRELRQISVGSCLLLRGLWLCIPVALTGGAVMMEHPAPPYQDDRASIFRTGIITLLLREGWLFRRHTFHQWRHGSEGVKPTTLLFANNKIPEVLDEFALQGISKPTGALIGRGATGSFRTEVAKEYPSNLCRCFAAAIWRRVESLKLRAEGEVPSEYASELAARSAWVDPSKGLLPDYQPI